jgi:tetratricopeptide (TPR) repeat protein
MGLGSVLSQEQEAQGEAVGFCRAALACRPDSFALHLVLGDALRQQGKPLQAAAALRRAARLNPDSPQAHLLLGEVLTGLDRGPEALAEFRRAVQLRPSFDAASPDAERFRQAERLVEADDRLPAVLRGEARPRDAADRVELAFACHLRELYAASARLYGEAFDRQPGLADRHRYQAAWAAVLAGSGKGQDAGKLGEAEKARLRGQALAWLRGEVDAWRRRLAKGPAEARAEVLAMIGCWLRDRDIAWLRDPASLAGLPAAERGDWERMWRDLRELRASAGGTK